ncbi:MAG: hypothetical protein ACLR23_09860 [Clostridia bacterium]
MGSEQKKRKRHWQQYLAVAVFMLIGAVCGILMVEYIDAMFEAEKSAGEIALSTALLLLECTLRFIYRLFSMRRGTCSLEG